MTNNETINKSKISTILSIVEKVFLLSLVVGVGLLLLNVPISVTVISISLGGLAIKFFISAFVPIELYNSQEEADEDQPFGQLHLLSLLIAPKVLWIGSSVTIFGLIMYLVNPEIQTFDRLLGIGAGSILVCVLLILVATLNGIKIRKPIQSILLRAIPTLLIASYILYLN